MDSIKEKPQVTMPKEGQQQPIHLIYYCDRCGSLANMVRKAKLALLSIAFFGILVTISLIFHVIVVAPQGVIAHVIRGSNGPIHMVAHRGLDMDTTSIISETTSCTTASVSTMPTPSDVYVTKTVDGATATADMTVSSIADLTTDMASCAPHTVTVTVTTVNSYDAVSGSSAMTSTEADTNSTSLHGVPTESPTDEPAADVTSTSTTTVSIGTTSTTTTVYTIPTGTESTSTSTETETDTAMVTIIIPGATETSISTTTNLIGTGTGTGGVGTVIIATGTAASASASWGIAPSAGGNTNGTFTYGQPPSVSATQTSSVATSGGNSIGRRGNGHSNNNNNNNSRGVKGGYCVVMMAVAVACVGVF